MTRKTTLQNTAGGVGTTAGASAAADPAQKFLDTFLKATRKQVLKDQTQSGLLWALPLQGRVIFKMIKPGQF
ncbi:hypothetical protein ROTO_35210 [Roseovarius tolerans]|uniref:Uncharacterized protein n=1 Tax=Roseovarius tolerans TaxID=74031 RepID=A0A0L6CQD0_9RHOB|nr:hypothetical protein [Roseovarius tolerans]KNX39937.1 hypothetical protein ROTO_35210 [Roseovarius tolerans]